MTDFTEQTTTLIHINAPKPWRVCCQVNFCPTCEKPRRMLVKSYEWYGTDWTCTGCGEKWDEEGCKDRPFAPRWRKENIQYARKELAKIGIKA